MKKLTSMLLVGIATLFFTACGGGSSSSTPPPSVNVLGAWDYLIITENSVCDGLSAQGVEIIEPLDGDTSKIGNIIIDGEGYALTSNQTCYLTSVYDVSTRAYGVNSVLTGDEYLNIVTALTAGDNTIKQITVDSFTDYKIQDTVEYTNGVKIRTILTR